MPSVANELGWRGYPEVRLATLALYAGLVVGAAFWGMTCDVVGRRLAVSTATFDVCGRSLTATMKWNATILISAIFGIAAGAATSFPVFGVFLAMIGFGAGGNLPVVSPILRLLSLFGLCRHRGCTFGRTSLMVGSRC